MIRSLKVFLSKWAVILLCSGLGILAFIRPFFTNGIEHQMGYANIRSSETPWMVVLAISLCVLVIIYEIQTQSVNTCIIAFMGMLVAINSSLRFLETAIPGPGGFSPIFFLIIMVGYVFGCNFGFLMGALTLIVSALITGGVGPWLPGQMFTAGWVGMSAPLIKPIISSLKMLFSKWNFNVEVASLAVFGAIWGLLFGAIMNLWSWPFISGPSNLYWAPGTGTTDTLYRYLTYYIMTSLTWDFCRSIGNILLILVFGAPVIKILNRFKNRFSFTYNVEMTSPNPNLIHTVRKT